MKSVDKEEASIKEIQASTTVAQAPACIRFLFSPSALLDWSTRAPMLYPHELPLYQPSPASRAQPMICTSPVFSLRCPRADQSSWLHPLHLPTTFVRTRGKGATPDLMRRCPASRT